MEIIESGLAGLLLLKPKVFADERGFFMETFRQDWLPALGLHDPFIQDNHARSEAAGVMRGLHFQAPPKAQSKLVSVVAGSVYDVAVDIRKGSSTYGQWRGFALSARGKERLLVPRGFAHGYMTLEPGTEVQYKVDAYYAPECEGGILWNDPDLNISWPDLEAILSEKDRKLPRFVNFITPF
ncbi:dTDP-4-dehydrorhamnose 3,5-epimerase [Desulfovibrio sp. OttesenSCG-928-C14]|nr:dTDP-4-dehydrorhamnose 3,5-epimerase [Desulfovibrio sp. OttesenSCG-928-C14]